MIPQYPTFEERKVKPKTSDDPIWDIVHCIIFAIDISTVNSLMHLRFWYGSQIVIPVIPVVATYVVNFIFALSVVFFLYLNPVDNSPTND
jgi:hypothetical protein